LTATVGAEHGTPRGPVNWSLAPLRSHARCARPHHSMTAFPRTGSTCGLTF
jgi:hypothetical protein